VGDDDDGAVVLAGESAEDFEDVAPADGIEGSGGFVGEEDAGLAGEGAGDGNALFLAAGEVGGVSVALVGEADRFEQFGGGPGGLGHAFEFAHDADVLFGGEGGEEVEALEDEAEQIAAEGRPLAFGHADDFAAVDADAAGGGAEDAAEDGDEGGFAGAGGSHEDEDLTGVDVEGDIVEGAEAVGAGAVFFDELGDGDEWLHGVVLAAEDHRGVDGGGFADGEEAGAHTHEEGEAEDAEGDGPGEFDQQIGVGGGADDGEGDRDAEDISHDGGEGGLENDDLIDLSVGGAHGFEGAELLEMVDGGGVDGLGDDDDADEETEHGSHEGGGAGAGAEDPVVAGAEEDFVVGEDFDARDGGEETGSDGGEVGAAGGAEEDEDGFVLPHGDVVLGVFEAGEDVGGGGEGADAVREADDPGAFAIDLEGFPDVVDAEFGFVEVVDDDGVFASEVFDASGDEVPGAAHAGVEIETRDLAGFKGTVGELPVDEEDGEVGGVGDARDLEGFPALGFLDGGPAVDMGDTGGGDPEVGGVVFDDVGGGIEEAEEHAELNGDEDEGEDDTGEGNDEADTIVEEVFPG